MILTISSYSTASLPLAWLGLLGTNDGRQQPLNSDDYQPRSPAHEAGAAHVDGVGDRQPLDQPRRWPPLLLRCGYSSREGHDVVAGPRHSRCGQSHPPRPSPPAQRARRPVRHSLSRARPLRLRHSRGTRRYVAPCPHRLRLVCSTVVAHDILVFWDNVSINTLSNLQVRHRDMARGPDPLHPPPVVSNPLRTR